MVERRYEKIMDIALKRGFLMQSNEIYSPVAGFYDYGPIGALIKNKIEQAWRAYFLRSEGYHEIQTATILPEKMLIASGHVAHFSDPIVSCLKCNQKFRADKLIEENLHQRTEHLSHEEMNTMIRDNDIRCPSCNGRLGLVGVFKLMFRTYVGVDDAGEKVSFLRPETAQGIFVDFNHIFKIMGNRLPMGIGQIGRSFRNEISPRRGLIRLREFTQMELEYFFNPEIDRESFDVSSVQDVKVRVLTADLQKKGESKPLELTVGDALENKIVENKIMAYFIGKTFDFYTTMGIDPTRMWFRELLDDERPHYSASNFDLEVDTSYGTIETVGIAYRTDFDISAHSNMSGKDLSVFDGRTGKQLIPHVVEPSFGVDRLFWCVLEHAYRERSNERDWEWFDIPPIIAPYTVAVFPLVRKGGLPDKARRIHNIVSKLFDSYYADNASIGRRYARADEIGVPYCITVDFQTIEDNTVTVRFRNDAKQVRVKMHALTDQLNRWLEEARVHCPQ